MKKILVSQCLYGGDPVRYDGRSKEETDPRFLKWKEEGRLIPVCPEVFGGLPVPRADAQRKGDKVVTRDGRDVTAEYLKGAEEAARLARENDVVCALLKEKTEEDGEAEEEKETSSKSTSKVSDKSSAKAPAKVPETKAPAKASETKAPAKPATQPATQAPTRAPETTAPERHSPSETKKDALVVPKGPQG